MPVYLAASATLTNKALALWSDDTVAAASTQDAAYPAINVTDPATFSSWRATSGNPWIRIDKGSPVAVDSVGISAHNIFTSGVASILVQSSTDASSWTTRATVPVSSDEDIIAVFPSVTARYWRITWTGAVANIGVLMFGSRLVFPHAPIDSYTPLHHARQYTKMFNDSIKGQFLGNKVMAAGAETDVDLGFVERSFVEGDAFRAFQSHYNQGGTFFYAGCPLTVPLDMGYCRAASEDEVVAVEFIEGDGLANLSFGVRSYVGI